MINEIENGTTQNKVENSLFIFLVLTYSYVFIIKQATITKYIDKSAPLEPVKEMAKNGNSSAQEIKDNDDKNHAEFCKKSVKAIVDNPKMKEGMLNDIRKEFPLKAVSDGEETMAIGPNSLDKKTMEKIFGTSDYEKLKENLVAEPPKQLIGKDNKPVIDKKTGEPKMSLPYIGYKIEASGEVFPVADIKVREDGRGYGGQFKFEMILNQKSFAKRLEKAQSDVYDNE